MNVIISTKIINAFLIVSINIVIGCARKHILQNDLRPISLGTYYQNINTTTISIRCDSTDTTSTSYYHRHVPDRC